MNDEDPTPISEHALCEDTDEAAPSAHLAQRRAFDVFISYRVKPDQKIASEFKALLESSIEPTPKVFVSGVGGLKASSHGYREQIQGAAQEVSAFVSIITQESIDREWMFFEAGAAFGRAVTYAPILIDTHPGELPSSIGGYQATRANDQENLRLTIEQIAHLQGGELRSRFGNRYAKFARAVEAYGRAEDDSGDDESDPKIVQAVRLMKAKQTEDAERLFSELKRDADGDKDELARIEIARALSLNGGRKILDALERVDDEHHETAIYKLWRGDCESNPALALKYLGEAAKSPLQGFLRGWALTRLAELQCSLGMKKKAVACLFSELSTDDRAVKSRVASKIAGLLDDSNRYGKLALHLLAAEADPSRRTPIHFCRSERMYTVALFLAHQGLEESETEGSRLNRGLARHSAELPSLAYADYQHAAEAGISVAKVNMASMLDTRPVPAAGLQILQTHRGDYDAADPGFPFEVRSRLERAVQREENREQELLDYGNGVVKTLQFLANLELCSDELPPLVGVWCSGDGWRLELGSDDPKVWLRDVSLDVLRVEPFSHLYLASSEGKVRLAFSAVGSVTATSFQHGLEEAGRVESIDFSTTATTDSDGSNPGAAEPMAPG